MKTVNVLTWYELSRYMGAVAAEAGLSLHKSTKGYSYIQGKAIYLAPEPMPLDPEKAIKNMRRLLHEVAHGQRSDMEYWNDVPLKQESPLRVIWNMIEDHRIEYVQSKAYDGDADIFNEGMGLELPTVAARLAERNEADPGTPEQEQLKNLFAALLGWDKEARSDWMPACAGADPYKLTPEQEAMIASVSKHTDDLRKVREIEGKGGTKLTHELAKAVLRSLGGDPEEEEKQGEEARKRGDPVAGHGHELGKGDGDGDGKGDGDPADAGKFVERLERELSTSPNPADGEPAGGKGSHGYGAVEPALPHEFFVHNAAFPHKGSPEPVQNVCGPPKTHVGDACRTSAEHIRATNSSSEQLAIKMRKLVQIKTRSRTVYGQKQGKLHGMSLHRIAANVPGYSDRVFKVKQDHLDIDAAVAICIDMSGSMRGDRISHACAAAEMLSETVGNALGIPLMVYGFSEGRALAGRQPRPTIFVLREFTERQVPTEKLRDRYEHAVNHTMGNNPDADAVIWGFHQLRMAKGKRKILFVLSDGSPASGRSGDQDKYLKQVCKLIEQSPIKLFGLGLMDDCVRDYYSRNAVVMSASEIEPKIIQLVDNFILDGGNTK